MSEGSIESSDINDKDILDSTKQLRDDKGFIQFKYVCSDGHVIISEKFNQDQARKAVMAWCDVVRNQLVQRAQEQGAQKSRKKMVVVEDEGSPEVPQPVAPVKKPKGQPMQQTIPADVGDAFTCDVERPARPDVCTLRAERVVCSGAIDGDAQAFVRAKIEHHRKQVDQWKKVLKALQE